MMEAVRILKAVGFKPRRTIRIALWGGEETGLFGSRNYVKNHFTDTATHRFNSEGDRLSVYFNLDNGSGKIRGIYFAPLALFLRALGNALFLAGILLRAPEN